MYLRSILYSSLLLLFSLSSAAQLQVQGDGLAITEGTVFSVDGLELAPDMDVVLNNISLETHMAAVSWPKHSSIQRLYRFSRPLRFKGLLGLQYLDRELSGNKAESLRIAHAPFTTVNAADFIIEEASQSLTAERRVLAHLTEVSSISDVTAVTPESALPAYLELEIHNIVTPNDDGVNDTWIIKNIERYPNNMVRIFDRDGRLIYSKLGYDNSWDGSFNGTGLPEDTYYYVLVLDSAKGEETLSGFISIVRENK